jgi:hypothetical protein
MQIPGAGRQENNSRTRSCLHPFKQEDISLAKKCGVLLKLKSAARKPNWKEFSVFGRFKINPDSYTSRR